MSFIELQGTNPGTRGFLFNTMQWFIVLLLISGVASCKKNHEESPLWLLAILATGNSHLNPAGNGEKFVTVWDTTITGYAETLSNQIRLPLDADGAYDFTVDWGDGNSDTITSYDQPEVTHTYTDAGEYTVTITGTLKGFGFQVSSGDRGKLLAVRLWGQSELHNKGQQFAWCENLTELPESETPNLQNVTDLHYMFGDAHAFNQPLDSWDVSSVEDMSYMFLYATNFNQPLNDWDVSKVTNMTYMFVEADSFNQPLDSWDVSSVEDMSYMFMYADNFNQPLDGWNEKVLNVTDMTRMFYSAPAFSQDLSGWCVLEIDSEPSEFATDAGALTPPVWGTCP